jgi:hypothetical protein
MLSEVKYESQKISQKFSVPMRFILLNTGDEIQHGEITERFYCLERRYRRYYTDPCLLSQVKIRYDRSYPLQIRECWLVRCLRWKK